MPLEVNRYCALSGLKDSLVCRRLCVYNGNAWALLAIPALQLGYLNVPVPRSGRGFYGYYIGHLAFLVLLSGSVVSSL